MRNIFMRTIRFGRTSSRLHNVEGDYLSETRAHPYLSNEQPTSIKIYLDDEIRVIQGDEGQSYIHEKTVDTIVFLNPLGKTRFTIPLKKQLQSLVFQNFIRKKISVKPNREIGFLVLYFAYLDYVKKETQFASIGELTWNHNEFFNNVQTRLLEQRNASDQNIVPLDMYPRMDVSIPGISLNENNTSAKNIVPLDMYRLKNLSNQRISLAEK